MNVINRKLPESVSSLLHRDVYDYAVENIELMETHISWVILTGCYAYKIKTPINLGVLDFLTLEKTGDYAATQILRFYLLYQDMVRAKVGVFSTSQMVINSSAQHKTNMAFYNYLELAQSYLQAAKPMLIIYCGMSASGKTTLTPPLVEKLAAIRIRSDVERKRLFKLVAETDSSAAFNAGIYSDAASQQTSHHLVELADLILKSGYRVIIDAACLKYEQRELFHQLAIKKNSPFVIVEFTAHIDILRQRITSRDKGASGANLSVLEYQLLNWKPLQENEQPNVITVDTESSVGLDLLVSKIAVHDKENKAS